MTPTDYFKLLNIRTAKIIAVILVIFFAFFHGILHLSYGVTPCKGLLVDGMFKGKTWQPWGCMIHEYSQKDVSKCFRYNAFWQKKNNIVFIGDSRIRGLYTAVLNILHGENPGNYTVGPHSDLEETFVKLDTTIRFFWAPFVNQSMYNVLNQWRSKESAPSIIVISAALWHIKASNDRMIEMKDEYSLGLKNLRQDLERIANDYGTKILWAMNPPTSYPYLSEDRKMMTTETIDQYNYEAERRFKDSKSIILWYSWYHIVEEKLERLKDGLHMDSILSKSTAQILFNFYCNDNMNFNDGSCCKSSDKTTSIQLITFSFFAFSACLYLIKRAQKLLVIKKYNYNTLLNSSDDTAASSEKRQGFSHFLELLTRLGFVMAYFYICDRTNYFMKENKYFTPVNFWLPVLYVTVLGLFFNEETKQTRVLHREQTEEWKGWMQLLILIYHVTGASDSLPIYMHIRVLVSSYLFQTGYGHFTHFWTTGDCTFLRYLKVIFRMNFLTVLLCLTMNNSYQSYYFVPLISFWFTALFITLSIPPHVTAKSTESSTSQYSFVIVKILVLISVISILYMSEVFFEKIFVTRPWKALFVTADDDIYEWWFRWQLDRYSVVYGAIFAFILLISHRYKLYDDGHKGSLWPQTVSISFMMASIFGLLGYTTFAYLCESKQECNKLLPYISFIPIVSFILLRNILGFLRTRFSTFFAWFGRISLELFIGQYHTLLAADTHGILVLVPNYPVANILLTSYIFTCAAHEIHVITLELVPYVFPSDKNAIIRNAIIFLVIILPLAFTDGMF